MKLLVFISVLFTLNANAFDSCRGQTASCFDQCSAQHVTFQNASRCDTYFDQELGCHKAMGLCDEPGTAPEDRCDQYDSVMCFDPCSGGLVKIHFANSCSLVFDVEKGCSAAVGTCN